MRLTGSALAAIVLLILSLLAVPTTAAAQSTAVARSHDVQTATAQWSAVSTAQGAEAKVGEQAEAIVPRGQTTTYFDIVNVGDVAISGQFLTVATLAYDARGNSQGPRDPSQILMACTNGGWVKDSCKGTEVKLVWIGNLDFTSSVPLGPGERVTVKLTNKFKENLTFGTTINVTVSREDVRATILSNN